MTEIQRYLDEHEAFVVGCNLTDIIVKDEGGFIAYVYANGFKISEILWFEYAKIELQHDTLCGGGGPRDPNNPGYFWSETDFEKQFSSECAAEILDYIRAVRNAYPDHRLIPAFSVVRNSPKRAVEMLERGLPIK